MAFNSYSFIFLFLPLVLIVWGCTAHCPKIIRKWLLTIASLIFICYAGPLHLLVLLGSLIGNYILIVLIKRKHPRIFLTIGIFLNILFLGGFKYADFVACNLNRIPGLQIPAMKLFLPLGISFYTFQQIAMLVDYYRNDLEAVSFTDYCLFLTFFPKFISGPLADSQELLGQFRATLPRLCSNNLAHGFYLFSFGLFKKVIISQSFSVIADFSYTNLSGLSASEAWIAMFAYTMQIYYDFSGYTDMALGIGKCLGFELPQNFDSPYQALSIDDFWKRWHITLTDFLRRYIYFPLGGSRKGSLRTCVNILIVFLVSGIWHGSAWTFVLWGVLHGILQVANRLGNKAWERIWKPLRWAVTFLCVNLLWVFFRAPSLSEACTLISRLFTGEFGVSAAFIGAFDFPEITVPLSILGLAAPIYRFITMTVVYGIISWITFMRPNISHKAFIPTTGRAVLCAFLTLYSILSLTGVSTFIYQGF